MAYPPHPTNLNWPTNVPLWIFVSQSLDECRTFQSLYHHLCSTPSSEEGVGKMWADCWVYILNFYSSASLLNGESRKPGTDGNLAFLVFS